MKQIQPFQKHWLQITSIVVCRLNLMYQYEMDPTRTVGATEQTRDEDGWTDGQMDGWTAGNQYTPKQLH